jgi:lipopolysaccharide transport system ATP-binding protein
MGESIIIAKDLSKLYHIGLRQKGYRTLRETLADGLTFPIRNFRRIQQLTRFGGIENSDDQKTAGGRSADLCRNGTIWAIKNVSFQVKKGEVLGIIGRNGSGKSTLLKILSRITKPTTGEARIYGTSSSLLEVGTGFHPELTGRENIFLNGAILGMTKKQIESRFDEIVSFAEMEKFVDTPVKRYSSGMLVRLAFSVAAFLESDILIVDEVLAVGDLAFQNKCLGKMDSVARSGRTVLFVSHNLGTIERLCGRAILLSEGSIIAEGKPSEAIARYVEEQFPETNHSNSLVDHPGRVNGKKIILREARIYNNGEETKIFRSGDSMKIEIVFKSDIPIVRMHFGVAIETVAGQRMTAFPLAAQAPELVPNAAREGKITCEIPRIHLTPGVYYLTFLIRSLNTTDSSDMDRINKAVRFNVVASDTFSSDYGTMMKLGLYFEEVKWHFEGR